MDNKNQSSEVKTKKITVGLIFGWFFGVAFLLAGLGNFSNSIATAVIFIIAGLIALPPIVKLLHDKVHILLSGGVRVLAILVLVFVGATLSGREVADPVPQSIASGSQEAEVTASSTENKPTSVTATPIQVKQTNSGSALPVATETVSQRNAVREAKSYLNYSAFSHDGLVAQLEYEKFSHTDAVYGADNSGANWNEQAAKSAKQYMEFSGFSRGSLIKQLIFSKFTQEQAEYGANAVGL